MSDRVSEQPKSANPPYGLPPAVWGAIVAMTCCADGPQDRYGALSSSGHGLDPMVPVPLSWIVALRDRAHDLARQMEFGKDESWSTQWAKYPRERDGGTGA